MARGGCGSVGCRCTVVAGPGATVNGSGAPVDPYVVGAAPMSVSTGCGLAGAGTDDSPLTVATGTWPYDCPIDEAAGQVYCDSSGMLRGEPRPLATFVSDALSENYPATEVPAAANTVIVSPSLTIENPDPCREAFAITYFELDIDFDLPPNSSAGGGFTIQGIGGDEMQRFINNGPGTEIDWHGQVNKSYARTIPPGETLTETVDITMGHGSGGATYNRIQYAMRAFVFVL